MSITLVQNIASTANSTTASATWPSATTNGNCLLAVVGTNALGTSQTVTPPAGWTLLAQEPCDATNPGVYIYGIFNASSRSGTESFTISSSGFVACALYEYSGIATSGALDITKVANGSTNPVDTGTSTITSTGVELVFVGVRAAGTTLSSPASGYTIVDNVAMGGVVQYGTLTAITTGSGTQRCTVTESSTGFNWAAAMVTLKAATSTISRQQFVSNTGSSTTSIAATWTKPTYPGDVLIASLSLQAVGIGSATITTPPGWVLIDHVASSANSLGQWLFYIDGCAIRSGSETFSWGSTSQCWLELAEYTGLQTPGSLDQFAHNTGSSAAGDCGTTATTTVANELWFGTLGSFTAVTFTAPTNGFTIVDQTAYPGANQAGILEKFVSTTGTCNPGATVGSAFWTGVTATFKGGTASQAILIQKQSNTGTNTSIATTWPGATTIGNSLYAFLSISGSGANAATITPPAGWVQVDTVNNGSNLAQYMYYIEGAASRSGSESFGFNTTFNAWLELAEYYGPVMSGSLDKFAHNTGSSASPDSGTTATTSQPNELWLATIGSFTGTMSAPTNGFSIVDQSAFPGLGNAGFLSKVVSSAGAANTTVSGSSNSWDGIVATFKIGPVLLQESSVGSSAATSQSATWNYPTTTGNGLFACLVVLGNGAPYTVTPPSGWTLAVRSDGVFQSTFIYYIANSASRFGSETFTFTSGSNAHLYLAEYSNIATSSILDKTATNSGNSATADTGTTATTTQALELWLGGMCTIDVTGSLNSPTNGFVLQDHVQSGGKSGFVFKTVAATGAANSSLSNANSNWAGDIATFKAKIPAVPDSPPTRQPSQRFYPLEDFTAWWEQYRLQPQPITFLPTPFPPQRSQRHDPLPNYHPEYEIYVRPPIAAELWVPPDPPPTRQPSQRHDPLEDFTAWWEQYRLQPNPITFLPTPFPPQPSQRHDPLPNYDPEYEVYTRPPFVNLLPPDAPPTKQPSQRHDPIPDLTAWWEQYRFQPVPQTFLPTPFPPQRSQRHDPLPDYWPEWWRRRPSPLSMLPFPVRGNDSGTGTDSGNVNRFNDDTGTGTDRATLGISATDSGTGADSALAPVASDSGTGVDAVTLRDIVGFETATGVERIDRTIEVFDTGAAVDQLGIGYYLSDTATGDDSQTHFGWVVTDSGSVTDSAVKVPTAQETATGTEAVVINAVLTATDSGFGNDTLLTTLAAAIISFDSGTYNELLSMGFSATASDSATATEATGFAGTLSDAGVFSDSGTPDASINGTDTSAGIDSASITASVTGANDSAAGTDSAASTFNVSASDSGVGAELQTSRGVALTDLAVGTESGLPGAAISQADSATGSELTETDAALAAVSSGASNDVLSLVASFQASDSGTASDSLTPYFATSDVAVGNDSTTHIDLAVSDSGSGAESTVNGIGIDSASGSDSAVVTLVLSDSAVGVETVSAIAIVSSDVGTGVDFATPAWTTDSATGTDTAYVYVYALDSATATETTNIPLAAILASDSGAGFTQTDLEVALAIVSDHGTADDVLDLGFVVFVSDSGHGSDSTWNITANINAVDASGVFTESNIQIDAVIGPVADTAIGLDDSLGAPAYVAFFEPGSFSPIRR